MISLSTKKLREGMITAQGIYNARGASYLTKGTELNQQYIERLRKIGISKVNVTALDPKLHLLPPEDIVQEATRIDAIHRIFSAFQDIEQFDNCNLDTLHNTSERIVLDLLSQRDNLVQITDIRLHDDYTFSHSVNVAILATMLGSLCHLSKKELLELTLGGLLHDIGKLVVPAKILNKPSSLNDQEFQIIHQHPEAGRLKLSELKTQVSPLLATIAVQHHEHMDGRGYPNHLMGHQIHRYSRIAAIADVYDALTSQRPYKKAYKPYTAYRIMTKCSGGQFDEDLLRLFFDNVALYPVGTVLKTDMGYAIVRKVKFGLTRTPIICVFADNEVHLLPHPIDVDLTDCQPDAIEHVIEDQELYTLLFKLKVDPAMYLTEQYS